jgi:hypothetical protein
MTDKLDEIEKAYTVYMDATDYFSEQGRPRDGNQVFATPEAVLKHRRCASDCGVVEVEITFKKWAQKPNPDAKLYTPEEAREELEARRRA